MIAALIPTDPAVPVQLVDVPEKGLAAAVGGQWFELVRHPWLAERGLLLVVDEEGRLTGRPLNPRASRFHRHGIVGDALIVAEAETSEGRDLVGLAPFQVGMITGLPFLGVTP